MGRDLAIHHFLVVAEDVSTHAPAWGATQAVLYRPRKTCSFNPRARMGRDRRYGRNQRRRARVSTRAPAWGATWSGGSLCWMTPSFNPRARMGRDIMEVAPGVRVTLFQPMRPHGARLSLIQLMHGHMRVSTHAPAWGATASHGPSYSGMSVSTHAPAWGAT